MIELGLVEHSMLISAVIPTKNRSADLLKAVASVIKQCRVPDELIVVDQSDTDITRAEVQSMLGIETHTRLIYIYDPSIHGLVDAKRVAVSQSSGHVVCFLEDDVVLEPSYIEEMERGFNSYSDMMGCCGVVTNLPHLPANYVRHFHLFHRGIFYDTRVGIHGHVIEHTDKLILSNYLSGGTSAFRRMVFEKVPFDLANGFFMLEDIDFSTRATKTFGNHFFINPRARLAHYMSPVNRAVLDKKYRRKLREFIIFYKKHGDSIFDTACLIWLLFGLWIEAVLNALHSRRIGPVTGYVLGVWDGVRWSIRREDACA